MAGTDLLDGGTGTPAVSRWSESGQGILGAKEGRGVWFWSAVVVAVLSSRMLTVGCSLAGRRDTVSCLAITAMFGIFVGEPEYERAKSASQECCLL